jgi:hypothetical protein
MMLTLSILCRSPRLDAPSRLRVRMVPILPHGFRPVVALLTLVTTPACAWAWAPDSIVVTPGKDYFDGKADGHRFPKSVMVELPGREAIVLRALGSGVRRKFIFSVYEGVLYVEQEADLGSAPYTSLVEGQFSKRIVMQLMRDASVERILGSWQDGLARSLKGVRESPSFTADKDRFLAFFDSEIKKGETIEITWVPESGIFTVVAGQHMPVIDNAELASHLLAIWLGDDPISDDLKRDVVRFLKQDGE